MAAEDDERFPLWWLLMSATDKPLNKMGKPRGPRDDSPDRLIEILTAVADELKGLRQTMIQTSIQNRPVWATRTHGGVILCEHCIDRHSNEGHGQPILTWVY